MGVEAENKITMLVGEGLFSFDSFQEWVNTAESRYRRTRAAGHNYVAVDAIGRICRIGKHFMRARAEGAFPVRVFKIL